MLCSGLHMSALYPKCFLVGLIALYTHSLSLVIHLLSYELTTMKLYTLTMLTVLLQHDYGGNTGETPHYGPE
jgi:hypothetical protein